MNETTPLRPGPTANPESAPFWDGLTAGEVRVQRCQTCSHAQNYARSRCTACWGDQLAWEVASGDATLRTWTVVHRPGHIAWIAEAPYAVVVAELSEGPRVTTRWRGPLDELVIGMPLRVHPSPQDGYRVLVAEPAGTGTR